MPVLSRAGYRVAQVGGTLIIIGGVLDLMLGRLLPNHVAVLGVAAGQVPEGAERLILALLHALGAALVACGFAVLILLRQARLTGDRVPLVTAAFVAALAEGMNAFGMYQTGSTFYIAPMTFAVLVVFGVALCLAGGPPPRRGQAREEPGRTMFQRS